MGKSVAITEEILKRIRLGVYQDRVPGERALAVEFGVNFKTANRAVSALVDRGLLVRKRGEGTFVNGRKPRSTLTVGLAFYKTTDPGLDPVFTRLFCGINAEAREQGCRVDVATLRDTLDRGGRPASDRPGAVRSRFADDVAKGNPDGVIMVGNVDATLAKRLLRDRPCVVVGELPPGGRFDNVRRDIRGGMADAVKLLAARGHERIAHVTYRADETAYDIQAKRRGYEDGIEEASLSYRKVLALRQAPDKRVLDAVLACSPRPTAVVASESTLGLAIVRHAAECGVSIPGDLALIAFDDGDVGEVITPRMSSLHAFGAELGRLAVRELLARLDGEADGRVDEVLPCEVVERESTMAVSRPRV